MNDAHPTTARPGARPSLAKPPRGAKSIAAVQGTMKAALERLKGGKDPAVAIAAKWWAAHGKLPRLDRDVSTVVADRQRQRFERALARLEPIEQAAAQTAPTTSAGAGALLRLALKVGGDDMGAAERGMIEKVAGFLEREARL